MRQSHRLLVRGLVIGALLVLAGCSGNNEDPRISLCKNLLISEAGLARDIAWAEPDVTLKRPEFARIQVATDKGRPQAACYYAYDTIEENVITQTDPLSAYATLPYAMQIDGRKIGSTELLQMVNDEQRRLGNKAVNELQRGAKSVLDKTQNAADMAVEKIRQGVDAINNR